MTAAGIQESHDAGHIRAKKSAGNESQFGPLTKKTPTKMSLMVFELQKHTYHKAIGFFFYSHIYIYI